jgi:hypothetical protein
VDTFPFLAVLLCAMGSLILVLMAMDLRARKAAVSRGREEARRRLDEQARALAERDSTYAAKKKALRQDWEKKRDALIARVGAAESALAAELRQVQARLAEAAGRMKDEQGKFAKLRQRLEKERSLLVGQQQALASARKEAATVSARAASTDESRAKLVDQLVRLELALKALKEERERDAQTYSVIPYLGKHGESRRPLYIECAVSGFIFHPDKVYLGAGVEPGRLRAEIQDRAIIQIKRMKAEGAKDTRPYIMLLVRPNGIHRYYQAQAALRDLSLEYGYEFVDADWILKVPVDGPPSTSQLVDAKPVEPRPPMRGGPGFLGSRPGSGTSGGNEASEGGSLMGGSGRGGTGFGIGSTNGPPGGRVAGTGPGGFGGSLGTGRPGGPGGPGRTGNGVNGAGWPGATGSVAGGRDSPGLPVIGSEGPGLGTPMRAAPGGAVSGQPGMYGGPPGSGSVLVGGASPGERRGLSPPSLGTPSAGSGGPKLAGPPGSGSVRGSEPLNPLGLRGGGGPGSTSAASSGTLNPMGVQGGNAQGPHSGGGIGTTALTAAGVASSAGSGGPQRIGSTGAPGSVNTAGGPAGQASGIGPDPKGSPLAFASSATAANPIPPPSDALPPSTPPPMPAGDNSAPSNRGTAAAGGPGSATGTGSSPTSRGSAAGAGGSAGADGSAGGALPAAGGSPGGPPAERAGMPGELPPPGSGGSLGMGRGSSGSAGAESAEAERSTIATSKVVDVPHIAPEAPPLPNRKPVYLRPARVLGDGDYTVFIECHSEYVVIYPSRRRVSIDALSHSRFHNSLYKAVEQMIARRLSTLRPGEKEPRIQVRFLVHPDGDRSLHLAYPVLETLPGEKVRYNLQPEDDVARIISAY